VGNNHAEGAIDDDGLRLVDGDDAPTMMKGSCLELKMALSFVNEWQGSPLMSGQDTPKQWQTNLNVPIPSPGPK